MALDNTQVYHKIIQFYHSFYFNLFKHLSEQNIAAHDRQQQVKAHSNHSENLPFTFFMFNSTPPYHEEFYLFYNGSLSIGPDIMINIYAYTRTKEKSLGKE